ncbi:MAG: double-strand break repair helicase AddA [Alphaproteobacteria bacterium]|nr:double-strand break repair helicase AddA [Alphaproteobacteria bacterium]MDE2110906.1 double-strand break repair helicase AddA [Alphaproteobacteria bacterium]
MTTFAASDPNRSAWVAANAGAGKTHTLANRVTRLLLAGVRPERILCLTYTKAAAAEMAGRLFDQLGKWSMLPDKDLTEKIAEVGAEASNKNELRKARRLFADALETPGGLKIQTIHSFCQYVLMRFPLEAGVPASFRVLDDRTARDLRAEARAKVLERAGSGDAPTAAALAFLVTHLSDFKLEQILDAALGADRNRLDAFLGKDDWSALLRDAHGAAPGDSEEKIATEFTQSLQRDEATLRDSIVWLASGGKTDGERAAALTEALQAKDALARFGAAFEALLTKEGAPRKTLATKKLAEARPDLLAYLRSLGGRLIAFENRRRAVHAAMLAEAALTIVDAVRDVYTKEKRARGVLDYDDLIAKTHRLLQKSGAAWVLFKLDEGIDHILIDEAQDTSALQWDIIQTLTDEFFAGEGIARETPRTLFAVGDEKQSIFSFQGADPAQFDVRRRFFEKRAKDAGRAFSYEYLQTSRRSAPEILKFVDAVFADPAACDGLTSGGLKIEHKALRTELKGRVEFWPALKPSDASDSDPWDLRPVDLERDDSPLVKLADQIADQIKDWLAQRVCLPGHQAPIQPGGIMILLPRREPFGGEIIRRLKERGVPVAGADRIKLTEQIAVMDLIALGRFALLPEDDLNLAALLRSPLIGLNEEELFALAYGREGTLWREVERRHEELPSFKAAHTFLAEARARADFAPPFEFFAQSLIDGRKKMLKRLGPETNDSIDELLSLALVYENSNTASLEGFLHWVERGAAEVKRDMERGRNEVRVMTVHGAKGLEADIVILPDTTSLPDNSASKGHFLYTDDGVLFPLPDAAAPQKVLAAKQAALAETLKEHRRLLYVALTRAKERLYICGFENKKGTKPGSWHTLAQRAAEILGTEMPHSDSTIRVFGSGEAGKAEPAAPAPAEVFAVPDWALTKPKPERPAPWLIRPSEAAGVDEPAMQSPLKESGARFRRGILVHAMLAHLPEISRDKRSETALRFLRARGASEEEAVRLTVETLAVLDDPAFAAAFAPNSRAEVSIVADLPELGAGARIHGRIDRLAVTADEVLIVDFKTNRPPPAHEKDVPQIYATQMALYRAAAAKIFAGRRIASALVWTEGPRLMPLPDVLLDAETSRIRARLDQGGNGS